MKDLRDLKDLTIHDVQWGESLHGTAPERPDALEPAARAGGVSVWDSASRARLCRAQSHIETLIMYKPSSRKFTTQNDLD